ncbi:hypothetical protein [Pedobacter aquatilis]|uniref:hypothetical protein n=1 Tax=Pedobacter aquatilis TaxID=351343 RepID=UPI00292FDF1E|nr:hypothetical protein [Pedobacter aquatilis]
MSRHQSKRNQVRLKTTSYYDYKAFARTLGKSKPKPESFPKDFRTLPEGFTMKYRINIEEFVCLVPFFISGKPNIFCQFLIEIGFYLNFSIMPEKASNKKRISN